MASGFENSTRLMHEAVLRLPGASMVLRASLAHHICVCLIGKEKFISGCTGTRSLIAQ